MKDVNFFAAYLLQRLIFRIGEFIRHWYLGSLFAISHFTLSLLETLDEDIALEVTLRNFFRPLYGDYTPLGRVLGFLFRCGRVFAGLLIYPVIVLLAASLYFFWALVPVYFLINIVIHVGF